MWLCPVCGRSNSSVFNAKCRGCGHVYEDVAMRIIKFE